MKAIVRIPLRDDFPEWFHAEFARLAIAFGRLERLVLLSMKSLLVTLGVGKNYEEGLLEAVRHEYFDMRCDELCRLFTLAYGEGIEAWRLGIRLETFKQLGRRRNKYIHASWTTDGDRAYLIHSRRDKAANRLEDYTVLVSRIEMAGFTDEVIRQFDWLYRYRETWPAVNNRQPLGSN